MISYEDDDDDNENDDYADVDNSAFIFKQLSVSEHWQLLTFQK